MTVPVLFQGERMHCILCDKEELSSPGTESQWRAISELPGGPFYACPDHFPPDTADSIAFSKAYFQFMIVAVRLSDEETEQ